MITRAALPLTVIGGFLGAGKTTLLNHWLRDARGTRLAVLVNDFGALNIDAELIESSGGDTVALSNGCVCCQIGDDLSAALIGVLESSEPFDAVVVEASGVSDPWRIAQFAVGDPGLSLDGVVVLVDAGAALQQSRDPLLADTLTRQLVSADLIVLNKIELADAVEREAVHAWIESIAPGTPCFETSQANVPLAMLTRLAMPAAAPRKNTHPHTHQHDDHDHDHDDHDDPAHGEQFETWSCQPAQAFDETTLRAWLRDTPPGLLRLKGIVRTGDGAWSELQFAGRHGSLRRAAEPSLGAAVVAIGLRGRLPLNQLETLFNRDAAFSPSS